MVTTRHSSRRSRLRHRVDLVTLAFIGVPVVFILGMFAGYRVHDLAAQAASQAAVETTPQPSRVEVSADDDAFIGPADAPVTIIEFGDYQCPACKQWHDSVFEQLLTQYPTQVRFVFRDFPLTSIHDQAESASEAAECAGEQDAYWEYSDAIFGQEYGLDSAAYTKYAQDLGLDMEAFTTCMESHQVLAEVQADSAEALRLGVQGTPAFFINGILVGGSYPFEYFKQIIDQELAGIQP